MSVDPVTLTSVIESMRTLYERDCHGNSADQAKISQLESQVKVLEEKTREQEARIKKQEQRLKTQKAMIDGFSSSLAGEEGGGGEVEDMDGGGEGKRSEGKGRSSPLLSSIFPSLSSSSAAAKRPRPEEERQTLASPSSSKVQQSKGGVGGAPPALSLTAAPSHKAAAASMPASPPTPLPPLTTATSTRHPSLGGGSGSGSGGGSGSGSGSGSGAGAMAAAAHTSSSTTAAGGAGAGGGGRHHHPSSLPATATTPSDLELVRWESTYGQLGVDAPPQAAERLSLECGKETTVGRGILSLQDPKISRSQVSLDYSQEGLFIKVLGVNVTHVMRGGKAGGGELLRLSKDDMPFPLFHGDAIVFTVEQIPGGNGNMRPVAKGNTLVVYSFSKGEQ